MKAIYALLVAALLTWSGIGCGGGEEEPPAGNGNGTATDTGTGTGNGTGTNETTDDEGNPTAVEEEPVEGNELPEPE